MNKAWPTSLRLSLCALALTSASLVGAQTQQPAEQVVPMHGGHPAAKKMHKPEAKKQHMHDQAEKHRKAKDGNKHHSKDAKKGQPGAELSEYERNALRRCEVFQVAEDRAACVARMRQPSLSGSVDSGGIIRQATQPSPSPMQHHHMHKPN